MSRTNDLRAKYSPLKQAKRLYGTIEAAIRLRLDRDKLAGELQPAVKLANRLRRKYRVAIPLGSAQQQNALEVASKHNVRIRRWKSPVAISTKAVGGIKFWDTDEGKYSNSCTWHKINHHIGVTSYAYAIDGGKTLRFALLTETRSIKAPHGYLWGRDENGIKLFSKTEEKNDYHPDSDDLIAGGKNCVARLKENAATRKRIATEQKTADRKSNREKQQEARILRQAEREGLTVCVADSRRAGNCLAGSVTWAARHGLDPARHYSPSELLAVSNGDTRRVATVVAVALKRHRAEMERGFAILEEHVAK